jgi:hypothetical protein
MHLLPMNEKFVSDIFVIVFPKSLGVVADVA